MVTNVGKIRVVETLVDLAQHLFFIVHKIWFKDHKTQSQTNTLFHYFLLNNHNYTPQRSFVDTGTVLDWNTKIFHTGFEPETGEYQISSSISQ